jgi:hypothetical protein
MGLNRGARPADKRVMADATAGGLGAALRQAGVLGLYGACALALVLAPAARDRQNAARARVDRLAEVLGAEVEAALRVLRPLAARLGDGGDADDGDGERGTGGHLEWREFARLADSAGDGRALADSAGDGRALADSAGDGRARADSAGDGRAPGGGGRLVAWVPHVPEAMRVRYEQGTGNDGYRSFTISDLDARGRSVGAARRGDHFPVHLIAPVRQGDPLLGLDLAGHPDLRAGIARARAQRAPAMAGPLWLRGPQAACAPAPAALCDPQLVVILPVGHAGRAPAGVLVAVLPWHPLAAAAGDPADDPRVSREAVLAATARLLARLRQ